MQLDIFKVTVFYPPRLKWVPAALFKVSGSWIFSQDKPRLYMVVVALAWFDRRFKNHWFRMEGCSAGNIYQEKLHVLLILRILGWSMNLSDYPILLLIIRSAVYLSVQIYETLCLWDDVVLRLTSRLRRLHLLYTSIPIYWLGPVKYVQHLYGTQNG